MPIDPVRSLLYRDTLPLPLDGASPAPPEILSAALARGLWPGIRNPPSSRRDANEVASASTEPWVDANGWMIAVQRALQPERPAVLAYEANGRSGLTSTRSVPFETLELALAEARVMGGNYVLSVDPRYREALLKGDAKALAAWKQLNQTAQWLDANHGLFGRPALPVITLLIEPGVDTAELANLMFRRGASPSVVPAAAVPAPSPGILALVAASLKNPPDALWTRILQHAERGATVVIDRPPDPAWKLVSEQSDRRFYALGKGQVVAYKAKIADPSEFALDVIDIVTHARRAARLWNTSSVIPIATAGSRPGQALMHLVNYGSSVQSEIQVRIQGRFAHCTYLRPGQPPAKLETKPRGTTTEVFAPDLVRVATLIFEG